MDNQTEVFGESVSGDIANERVLHDFGTGLNTTTFCVSDIRVLERLAVKVVIKLHCDRTATPWCALDDERGGAGGDLKNTHVGV